MLLVVDVGNSNTVLGLFEGEGLKAQWRVVTGHYHTVDEVRMLFTMLLQQGGYDPSTISGCCISSVVPPLNTALDAACRQAFSIDPLFIGPGVKTGLVIQVPNPKEVGADRIANAVGALDAHDAPLIIIDFGTATTFDAVGAKAEYCGGVIVPGIQISADALCEKCAKLPRVDLVTPPTVIGRDTITNIQSGLTYGYADLVDGIVRRMKTEMDGDPSVIATGGIAPAIAEVAESIDHIDPILTLTGLRIIYMRNARAGS
jgi:type III pantothenate kinase